MARKVENVVVELLGIFEVLFINVAPLQEVVEPYLVGHAMCLILYSSEYHDQAMENGCMQESKAVISSV